MGTDLLKSTLGAIDAQNSEMVGHEVGDVPAEAMRLGIGAMEEACAALEAAVRPSSTCVELTDILIRKVDECQLEEFVNFFEKLTNSWYHTPGASPFGLLALRRPDQQRSKLWCSSSGFVKACSVAGVHPSVRSS